MSTAAVERVKTYSHPHVKGSARRLLEVIATQIPEGQTMTPPLRIEDLAALMDYGEPTARRRRQTLLEVGAVRILGGGQGQVSRYELLLLPDARGADPVLPLIGAAAPPRARRPRASDGPTFFDTPPADTSDHEGERTVENFDHFDRSWRRYFDHFDRSWGAVLRSLRSLWVVPRSLSATNFDHFDRSVTRERHREDIDGTRARDVHTFKNVHTHTPPADEPVRKHDVAKPDIAPCRWAGTVHAWCGRVCVPSGLHHELLRKGHDAAWLVAFYARTCAALPADEPIIVDDYKFWRAALKAELASTAPARASPATEDSFSRRELEDAATYRRMRFGGCPHDPRHLHEAECIREIAWWRRTEGERKQG